MPATDPQNPDYLVIGQITKPHGVRGELRVEVTTERPERYLELEEVLIAKNERRAVIFFHCTPF